MEDDHVHCLSCVDQRCMFRPQPGISCDLITCPIVCGAVFHSCKVDEHHLMCPLVRVPCLNSGYGCPATLVRSQMYAHLEVCPAGVVCCTVCEWSRWPVNCLDYTSCERLSRGVEVIAMAPTAEGEPLVPVSKENKASDSALLTSAPGASTIIESPSQSSSSYPSPFRTLRLGLVLEALEAMALPHNRYLPPKPRYQRKFPSVCGQSLRRDQFYSHFTNVHCDIHSGVNDWMEHRCPLACYGCTFSQRRLSPSTKGAKVVHDRHLRSFGVQPCPRAKLPSDFQSDLISGLPIEVLWHIAGFLDSFSLCQLSLVSRTMREVCASLLQTRGIVELQWERRQSPGAPGTVSWKIKNRVWRFSSALSLVLSWGFTDLPSMSDHLKKCHFNVVEHKTEPVPLPAMCTARDGQSLRRVLRHVNP